MSEQVYGRDWRTWHNPDGLAVQFPYKTAYPFAADIDWDGTLARAQKDLTTTATTTLDWDRHNYFNVAVTMDTTFAILNPRPNSDFVVLLTKDNSATIRTITWGFTIDWGDATPVTRLTEANETVLLYITYFGSAYHIASVTDAVSSAENFLSPLDYGAVANGTTDDAASINLMTAAADASGDSATESYEAYMTLLGKKYYVGSPINLTDFRAGHGVRFGDGTLLTQVTSGNVLDVTGSLRTVISDLTISTFGANDAANTGPDVGILYQRNGDGSVAGNHWCNNTTVKGVFNKAAMVNYASEACEYTGLFLQNKKRSETSSCLHIQRFTTSPGEAFASTFNTNATGAQSNIRAMFTDVICARAYPTGWTITAVSKANPGVFSYTKSASTLAPAVSDVITFENVASTSDPTSTWGAALSNYVWTIGAVTPTNSTSGTFTLTGVDTSGLTGDYDAAAGITINYKTGPGIRLVHRDRLQIEHFYVSTFGSYGVEIAYGGNAYRGLKLHGHVEGDAVQAWAKFICGASGDQVLKIHDLDLYEHTSHVHEDFFKTNATTGRIDLYNPKINIAQIRATAGPGEAPDTMRGSIFDDASKYYLYNADITVGDAGYMNLVSEFGHFSGRIHIVETGEIIVVPDYTRKETSHVHYYDEFDQWNLSPFWNTRLGTHGSCAIAPTSSSARGGRILISSGADAAGTFAANGAMLHGRAILRSDAAGIDIEFGCNPTNSLADMAYFVGLTDNDAALEFPAVLAAGDVITPTADDFVGFLYDSAADPAQEFWHSVTRGAAGTTHKTNLSVVPSLFVAGSTTKMRIKIGTTGLATFFIDGVQVATSGNTTVGPTVALCPIVAIFSRAGTSRNFSLDYFQIWGGK